MSLSSPQAVTEAGRTKATIYIFWLPVEVSLALIHTNTHIHTQEELLVIGLKVKVNHLNTVL